MTITVYGAPGNHIEVDGDVSKTFHYAGEANDDLLVFSDGTVLGIRPDPEYAWIIDVLVRGSGELETWNHTKEGDQARVHGATWVVHGIGWARVNA